MTNCSPKLRLLSALLFFFESQALHSSRFHLKSVQKFSLSALRTSSTEKELIISPPSRKQLSKNVYETILSGKIAVIPNFLPKQEINTLRNDAQTLYAQNYYSLPTDYGTTNKNDKSKDRGVFRGTQWKTPSIGNFKARENFGQQIADIRAELSYHLNRPSLNQGLSISTAGCGMYGSTEMSYTRFGVGAFLKKHVDEHHEECKGVQGWLAPTRRSISWLVYLNDDDWNSSMDGGQLRCYERVRQPTVAVGARPNGDLQIGWIKKHSKQEIPVFLDAKRRDKKDDCVLYIVNDDDNSRVEYISNEFNANPILYVAGSERLIQKLIITKRDLADRFQLIEPPQSILKQLNSREDKEDDTLIADVDPLPGTLVLFDSVSLPHEVLSTKAKSRWAISGWFHEDQQPLFAN